jgi:O-antigen/teichoic acid export membrane protein
VFGIISILTTHLMNALDVAVPVIASSIIPKLGMVGLILLTVYAGLDRSGLAIGLVLVYGIAIAFLWGYVWRRGAGAISVRPLGLDREGYRQLYALGGFSILGSFGSVLATHIDTIFVNTYLGDVNTAVYSFAIFATTVIQLPGRAIQSITSPIVAQEWKDGNLTYLGQLYRDSAAVLLAVGSLIYTGALVCLPHVYLLTKRTEDLAISYYVFVFLGAGVLFDLMTSINANLIGNTDYFRWNVLFVLLLGGVNVGLNYLMVVGLDYGIAGAAVATALSLFVYNLVKTTFVYSRMRLHPFSLGMMATVVVIVVAYWIATLIPNTDSPVMDILTNGSAVVLIFATYFRFTPGVQPLRQFLINWQLPFTQKNQ